jgi:L-seryl-tRNA(Ser) seleniumtransferase
MTLFDELGIRPVINAAATLTRLGGSRMPPEVLEAMRDAARSFVDLDEVQTKVGAELARLTHNEAAYVATGAAAGIALAVAACVTRQDRAAMNRLPDANGREVMAFKSHRNVYQHAVRMVGVRLIEIGDEHHSALAQLEAAFTDQTAAFVWFQGAMTGRGDWPLPTVIEMCRVRRVPVIVDAAAQLPPMENLWAFTQLGAAGAIFSGGKDLQGPQSSGLVVGQQWLIDAMRPIGNPNAGFGRPMKVGKEEMAGLLAAVKRYLTLDHAGRRARDERVVADWCQAFCALPGLTAQRSFPNEAGQPLPRCEVMMGAGAKLTRDELITALRAGTPSIEISGATAPSICYLNPMTLNDAEAQIVTARLVELLG